MFKKITLEKVHLASIAARPLSVRFSHSFKYFFKIKINRAYLPDITILYSTYSIYLHISFTHYCKLKLSLTKIPRPKKKVHYKRHQMPS